MILRDHLPEGKRREFMASEHHHISDLDIPLILLVHLLVGTNLV
jgi:hypothetical protein